MTPISRVLTGATCAGLLLIAGPAFAAGPYTVSAGGTTTGTTAFSGTAGSITFATPSASTTCSSGTAGGTLTLGENATGQGIASIDTTTFENCNGPLGTKFAVTQTQSWRLNATGTPTDGVTAGTIDQVVASVRSTAGVSCSFTVTGSVDGSFDQTDQSLTLTAPTSGADLKVSNVSGCFGLVSNGQSATMSTTYAISTDAGAVAIS